MTVAFAPFSRLSALRLAAKSFASSRVGKKTRCRFPEEDNRSGISTFHPECVFKHLNEGLRAITQSMLTTHPPKATPFAAGIASIRREMTEISEKREFGVLVISRLGCNYKTTNQKVRGSNPFGCTTLKTLQLKRLQGFLLG